MKAAGYLGIVLLLAGLVAACKSETDEERQSRFKTEYALSSREVEVMDAMLMGLNREARHPRNVSEAACYAKKAKLADRFHDVHVRYVSDYAKVEKDYYGWFNSRGLGSADADAVGNTVRAAWTSCRP